MNKTKNMIGATVLTIILLLIKGGTDNMATILNDKGIVMMLIFFGILVVSFTFQGIKNK